jgi:hypothetical protein
MNRLFVNGTYRGHGYWIDQKTEGRYTAQYTISDGLGASKAHEVERVFFKPDGTVAYEEKSTVGFEPAERGGLRVSIRTPQGSVAGSGYAFESDCHYEVDIAADNRLEFTFHTEGARIVGIGSATNKGNATHWRETLDWV